MDKFEFKLTDKDGLVKEYVALAFLNLDENKYIWYTLKNEEDTEKNYYISKYNIIDEDFEIIPITDKAEWDLVTKCFNSTDKEN